MDVRCLVLGCEKNCFIFPCQLRTCERESLFSVGGDAVTLRCGQVQKLFSFWGSSDLSSANSRHMGAGSGTDCGQERSGQGLSLLRLRSALCQISVYLSLKQVLIVLCCLTRAQPGQFKPACCLFYFRLVWKQWTVFRFVTCTAAVLQLSAEAVLLMTAVLCSTFYWPLQSHLTNI